MVQMSICLCPIFTKNTPPSAYQKKKITRNRCLKLKREEIERFKAIEEEKLENSFNIKMCITDLEGLSDIQIENMLKAANISKDSPSNREVFLSFSSDRTLNASTWQPISSQPISWHPPTSSPNSTREPHIQLDSHPKREKSVEK